jgi:plasmid maintenance system antidote protein VapI
MAKRFTEKHLLDELGVQCKVHTQKNIAVRYGMPASFINDVLKGRRNITDNLARAMGYEPLMRLFEKKAAK